jgi:Na+-translocating ferredoxin:NAD+ oxidoreductase RnfG subunit
VTNGSSVVTLTESVAGKVASVNVLRFVVVDFSETAGLNAKIQGQIKSADYFTMESPHHMDASLWS